MTPRSSLGMSYRELTLENRLDIVRPVFPRSGAYAERWHLYYQQSGCALFARCVAYARTQVELLQKGLLFFRPRLYTPLFMRRDKLPLSTIHTPVITLLATLPSLNPLTKRRGRPRIYEDSLILTPSDFLKPCTNSPTARCSASPSSGDSWFPPANLAS
jgi:hypothetical protein